MLHQDRLIGYSDETRARAGDVAMQIMAVQVKSLFESQATGGHEKDFYLQGKVASSPTSTTSTWHFVPPDTNDRHVWVAAIHSALNDSRGRTILQEQEAELALHAATVGASRTLSNPRLGFVVPHSSMEGMLQRVQDAFLHVARDTTRYYVLVHDMLRWFPTKTDASNRIDDSNNCPHIEPGNEGDETSLKVLSVSDWGGSLCGFQVDAVFRGVTGSIQFVAANASDKERWIRALKTACDEAVAEQTLRDILTRQASLQSQPSSEIFLEGFVHLRRSHFGAAWKEHYCVLKGPWLATYDTREDFATAPGKPTSKREVVFVGDWYGGVSAGGAKNMFRIETIEDGFVEAYVDDAADKPQWMQTLQTAVSSLKADQLVTRDLTLPSYAGATMEGYLTKHGGTVRGSLKRCVLCWPWRLDQENALRGDIRAAEARERSKAQQLQDTVNKSRVINEEAAALDAEMEATLKQLEHYNSGGDDDFDDETDDDDATPYVEYVDAPQDTAPENSPVRRASRNKTTPSLVSPPDMHPADDTDNAAWPWFRWCKCFAPRQPLHLKVNHDPMLTDHERRMYSCEFYSNGTIDSSL
ncbi:hypothetical protein DYB32_002888 [Aphanomyces invadans]|uniref:PH domain-containing protein n=1 Tax=Aphanomyces invadans TaxID=157072 RepID=A0A418B1Z1_9STRA|nr:hypothetical protein DYB32_002888 [Aphanomyces invadans]